MRQPPPRTILFHASPMLLSQLRWTDVLQQRNYISQLDGIQVST